MANRRHARIIALGLLLVAAGAGGYLLWRPAPAAPIVGVVRTTEIRIAPEVGGQLAAIKVQKGARVRAGDVVAELSALELTASVGQARAALAAATASRDHVYAGVRAEEIAALAAEIAKAKSRLDYAEAQLARVAYLARGDIASQQTLDQAENDVAAARADVAEAEANHAAARSRADQRGARHRRRAGPGRGRRARGARAAAGQDTLRAPADGVVSVIVAEIGENVRAGQPVLAIEADRQAVAVVQRARGPAARPHGGSDGRRRRGRARAKRRRPSSPSSCRSGRSRPGRPSARSAITIATRCACASIRKAMRPGFEPGMTVWLDR